MLKYDNYMLNMGLKKWRDYASKFVGVYSIDVLKTWQDSFPEIPPDFFTLVASESAKFLHKKVF